jgi:quinol monooxygenase YgiN
LDYFDARGSQIVARQQLTKTYQRNGVAYAITRECLLDQKKILGKNSGAVIISEPLVNIDTEEDFRKLESLSDSAIGVTATFTAKPGKEKELEAMLLGLVAPTHREAGCLHYSLHRSAENPGTFYFVEKWASSKDLGAHLQAPHVGAAFQKKDELVQSMAIVPILPLGGGQAEKQNF